MATPSSPFSVLLLFFCLLFFAYPTHTHSIKSTYIVHMSHSHKPAAFASHHDWYSSLLNSLSSTSTSNTTTSANLLYSYSRSATGFAAHISTAHAAKLRRLPSVLSVVPDKIVKPGTTRSPTFLGLAQGSGIWHDTNYGSGVIIGVVDSGIWPESESFNDEGLHDVPEDRWRGFCEDGPGFSADLCNKKLIGARFFYKGYELETKKSLTETKSARDAIGHGTHCASTAAGSKVINANYEGYALGTARGVAPNAHIAAYKVFWGNPAAASSADVLKAIDQAVFDGVDVISLSLGGDEIEDYDQDWQAIASFRAMKEGVVVSTIAGNGGSKFFTVENVSPWMLTVAASTIDREFPTHVVLGNGRTFKGASLSELGDSQSTAPLILITGEAGGSQHCFAGHLNSSIAGKIVICDKTKLSTPVNQSFAVKNAGGLGMILVSNVKHSGGLRPHPFTIPATSVTKTAGNEIKRYVRLTSNSRASIMFNGTVIDHTPPSPRLASFSSRGPNSLTPEILKPDVTAPGVNILAAWPSNLAPSRLDIDERAVQYNILSGTSMACPHVSGLAALLKQAHPSWSPSAIKSAIMTTSYNIDNAGNNLIDLSGKPSSPFVHGSGHIDPQRALDPGLVYDLNPSDYVAFLCSIGYSSRRIRKFVRDSSTINCRAQNLSRPGDLNYPSFAVAFYSAEDVVTYTRFVTNVGESVDAVYKVHVTDPDSVQVNVDPAELEFSADHPILSYTITFTSTMTLRIPSRQLKVSSGSIEWRDESNLHRVRSPIAVYWPFETAQTDSVASI